jgi:hypothetical protein
MGHGGLCHILRAQRIAAQLTAIGEPLDHRQTQRVTEGEKDVFQQYLFGIGVVRNHSFPESAVALLIMSSSPYRRLAGNIPDAYRHGYAPCIRTNNLNDSAKFKNSTRILVQLDYYSLRNLTGHIGHLLSN